MLQFPPGGLFPALPRLGGNQLLALWSPWTRAELFPGRSDSCSSSFDFLTLHSKRGPSPNPKIILSLFLLALGKHKEHERALKRVLRVSLGNIWDAERTSRSCSGEQEGGGKGKGNRAGKLLHQSTLLPRAQLGWGTLVFGCWQTLLQSVGLPVLLGCSCQRFWSVCAFLECECSMPAWSCFVGLFFFFKWNDNLEMVFFFHHLLIFLSWELFQILSHSKLWESHPAANRGGDILDLKHLDARLSQAQARWGNEGTSRVRGQAELTPGSSGGFFPQNLPASTSWVCCAPPTIQAA